MTGLADRSFLVMEHVVLFQVPDIYNIAPCE